jgi:hypothetical protein
MGAPAVKQRRDDQSIMFATSLTAEKRERFLAELRKVPNVTVAARAIEMSRQRMYQVREEEPEFALMWDAAIAEGVEMMEAELYRRGFEGVNKPIVHQGVITDTFKEYSDTLGIFLMKAHAPEKYRETTRTELTGADGGPVQVDDRTAAIELAALLGALKGRKAEDEVADLV